MSRVVTEPYTKGACDDCRLKRKKKCSTSIGNCASCIRKKIECKRSGGYSQGKSIYIIAV